MVIDTENRQTKFKIKYSLMCPLFLRKGMKPSLFYPVRSKITGLTGFYLWLATSLKEEMTAALSIMLRKLLAVLLQI